MACNNPKETDDLNDWEDPDESDQDDSEGPDLIPCPYCKKSIHDQAEWCHHCGKYISREDQPPGVGFWVMAGLMVLLMIAMVWKMIG